MRIHLFVVSLLCIPCLAQPEAAGPAPAPGMHPPAAEGASAYRLTPAEDSVILAWQEVGQGGVSLLWSRFDGSAWSEPRSVAQGRFTIVSNWADLPAVVEGRDGALYAHYLTRSGPGPAMYDIAMLRSTDDGETWAELGQLNDDQVKAEHGFVSYARLEEGLRAYWLDGRETGGAHGTGEEAGKMTLRTALVGETIAPSELLDAAVCDCCNTAAGVTSRGPLVAYRDREEGEIRDIAVIGAPTDRSVQPVHEDGWKMPGCPVNGPAMAAEGDLVVVAWYTGSPRISVKAAFSSDGGQTFGDAVIVDEMKGANVPLGRVDVVLDGDEAIVGWLRNERRKGVLLAQRVGPSGPVGEPVPLAPMDGGRESGFPQMERLGDSLVTIWRDVEAHALRTSRVPLDEIGG